MSASIRETVEGVGEGGGRKKQRSPTFVDDQNLEVPPAFPGQSILLHVPDDLLRGLLGDVGPESHEVMQRDAAQENGRGGRHCCHANCEAVRAVRPSKGGHDRTEQVRLPSPCDETVGLARREDERLTCTSREEQTDAVHDLRENLTLLPTETEAFLLAIRGL